MKLSDVFPLQEVEKLIASREIREHIHPDADTRMWSLESEVPSSVLAAQMRGVVFRDGEILARPIRKFWPVESEGFPETKMKNLNRLDFKKAVHTEFIDGHSGLLYRNRYGVQMLAGSDGSFRGQPWIWASGTLRGSHQNAEWPAEYSPNFCVVHPEHVKTLKYDEPRIYLIGMVHLRTGEELPWQDVADWAEYNGFAIPHLMKCSPWDFAQMGLPHRGVVMRWDFKDTVLRVGWLNEKYEQQSILANLTPHDIAEMIEQDLPLEPLKKHGSAAFNRWLETWRMRLVNEFYGKESRIVELLGLVENVLPPVGREEYDGLMEFFGKCVEKDTWALEPLSKWLLDQDFYPLLWQQMRKITQGHGRFEQ